MKYGYLIFRIEIGDGPDQMVYFHPRKYRAHWWMKGKNPDDFYLMRCCEENFVKIPSSNSFGLLVDELCQFVELASPNDSRLHPLEDQQGGLLRVQLSDVFCSFFYGESCHYVLFGWMVKCLPESHLPTYLI